MRRKWISLLLATLLMTPLFCRYTAAEVRYINTQRLENLIKESSNGEVRNLVKARIDTSTGRFWIHVTLNRFWCTRWEAYITGQVAVTENTCRLADYNVHIDTGWGCFFLVPGVNFIEAIALMKIRGVYSGTGGRGLQNKLCGFMGR